MKNTAPECPADAQASGLFSPKAWRTIPAATPTFRLDVLPLMGMRTAVVQCFITSAEMPECSSPRTRQVGASPGSSWA